MSDVEKFVPNILLCSDKTEFLSQIGDRPVNIVEQIFFHAIIGGKSKNFLNDKKFFMDGGLFDLEVLPKLIRHGDIDYFVYNDVREFHMMRTALKDKDIPYAKMISLREFKNMRSEDFRDLEAETSLLSQELFNGKKILDFGAYFLESSLLTKCACAEVEIDCIFDGNIPPIKENIYSRVYKNFFDCRLKHYDYALISAGTPQKFDKILQTVSNCDAVIIYTLHHSELEEYIKSIKKSFEKIDFVDCNSGKWLILYRKKPPEDFAMYVVTHKKLSPTFVEDFPEKYRLIHAGKINSQDFGYPGDDTGESISSLNPKLNEITALYWIWKNTSHTIIGLSHYRRFFTEYQKLHLSHEEILTEEQAMNILKDYDIIAAPEYRLITGGFETILAIKPPEFVETARRVIRKNLLKAQPDYVEAFDRVMNLRFLFKCNMFITRRNVFEAYCEWFFSFIINATQEFWRIFNFDETASELKRIIGYFAERMMTVWLMKNNLRVKEVYLMEVKGV